MTARWQRIPDFKTVQWRDDPAMPLAKQPPSVSSLRHEFANLVIRRLVDSSVRVAVIDDRGRPALVNCGERLYELLSKDHPVVGVYASGARVRDVIDDLKAAGL
jgi:hypothetical protein